MTSCYVFQSKVLNTICGTRSKVCQQNDRFVWYWFLISPLMVSSQPSSSPVPNSITFAVKKKYSHEVRISLVPCIHWLLVLPLCTSEKSLYPFLYILSYMKCLKTVVRSVFFFKSRTIPVLSYHMLQLHGFLHSSLMSSLQHINVFHVLGSPRLGLLEVSLESSRGEKKVPLTYQLSSKSHPVKVITLSVRVH